jgi:aryl-alcohol dehydrogenase-like predicted oxidoreductase
VKGAPARSSRSPRRRTGTTWAIASGVALAWLLARSPAMLTIGNSSVKYLENVAAAEITLTPEDMSELGAAR